MDPLRAAHHLLVDLVHDKEVHATERLFLLLGLLFREDFGDVWRGLRSKDPKRRASSLELIENLVPPPLRGRVLELVGDGRVRSSVLAYEDALREMLARAGGTILTLAELRAAELALDVVPAPGPAASPAELAASLGARVRGKARALFGEAEGAGEGIVREVTRAPA